MRDDTGTSPVQPSRVDEAVARRAPEALIGGFSRRDSTVLFYSLIQSVIEPHFRILDFGAGRGAQHETAWRYKRELINLRGKVASVVGVDVDDAVLENPQLDEAYVFTVGDPLPFADGSFDLIFSDWVLEHVDDPATFVAEITRLLKPGGWFFARTPNRFGAIAIGATLIPNALHRRVLRVLQPDRLSEDVFPTRYRLNRRSAIRRWFTPDRWANYTTTIDTELMYFARFPIVFELAERISRVLPSAFRPVLLVSVRKR